MKKSERLNDMMLFLNGKNKFNLKDIMEKYNISRSSAIRDIKSLEEIGMPIYTQLGRNGAYNILPNRLLSPIVFAVDEMYSLYFAMLTLKAYQSTPFHLSVEKLKTKFEACLSPGHIVSLHKMEAVFQLNITQHPNESIYLKEMLQSAIGEKPCTIEYKNKIVKKCIVQFFNISSDYGQWYGTAFNFETQKVQVFRCDKILSVSPSDQFEGIPLEQFNHLEDKLYKDKTAVEFEVLISDKGVDLFYKEHYPSMKLFTENGRNFIKGFYNHGEETFIADYFIHYAYNILDVKPATLKTLIADRLRSLLYLYDDTKLRTP